jgi:two-component system, LytTR family, response regulator
MTGARVPPLTVLIADDEPVARRGLRRLLQSRAEINVVAECDNGLAAVELIARHSPDLALLDVQMPGIDGIEVARQIGAAAMPMVVFVTAFDEFAISAFEAAAVDYVVKPFSDERLMIAVDRVLARRDAHTAMQELARLMDLVARETRVGPSAARACMRERFLVSIGRKNAVIHAHEIAWIRASGYYVTFITSDRKEYLARMALDQLESELDPAKFLRVHRSAIVALSEIHEVDRGPGGVRALVLKNRERIPISKSRRDAVFSALGRGA